MTFPYRYAWGPRFRVPGFAVLDRRGGLCRVIVRGAMNSALIEFEDGARAVVSRDALRLVLKKAGAVTGPTPPRSARDRVTRIRCKRPVSNRKKRQ